MWTRVFLPMLLTFILLMARVEPKLNENKMQPEEGIPPYLYGQSTWADSLLQTMTLEERIGQLFMVAAYSRSNSDPSHVADLIKKYSIGGVIFMQGEPSKQAILTNYFQSISKVPLMIGQDAEWGLSMRIDSTVVFPREIMLGAIQDNNLIYEFGKEMARECKRIGVNVSFSPVVDINSNALNPVIGDRSFGENKLNVASKGIMYMRGLQDGGVLACAKHFPGHGDTDKDSHKTLPTVSGSRARLDSIELFPFQKIIDAGVGSVMIAHLNIPSLDSNVNLPSTLSKKIVTGLLKVNMGFKGLSFTDALNMKGVTDYYPAGEADVRALIAGNDILLFPGNVSGAVEKIKEAIQLGTITQDEIDSRVRKILQAKFWLDLSDRKAIETIGLYDDLNNGAALLLKQKLCENAITVVKNKQDLIPIKKLESSSFASVAVGAAEQSPFQKMLSNYAAVTHFQISKNATNKEFENLKNILLHYDTVFVAIQNMSRSPAANFGITQNTRNFIKLLLTTRLKIVLTVFGSPYSLEYFDDADWLVDAYNDDVVTQQVAAQVLFGGLSSKGRLPVTASGKAVAGSGVSSASPFRLSYTLPEAAGISSQKLSAIDSLVLEAIHEQATPGCQVWVAKEGKVIWKKSYGNFTYDLNHEVEDDDIYDIASITKIAATTLMVMKLYDERKIDLNKTIASYLPEFKDTDKENIKIHQLLTHEAGFVPYFPFYKATLDTTGNLKKSIYSNIKQGDYTLQVTPDIFMNRNYTDSMWYQIVNTPLLSPGKYIYSDNDFYILKKVAEKISGEPMDDFLKKHFYDQLGLSRMSFNPLKDFQVESFVPSNYDFTFRKEMLQGTVHDQGAAMLGGVAGHAGLFSNADDLGTLMQMLLNNGSYGGKKYLDSTTVARFTGRNGFGNRRGLGFDKPETEMDKASPVCEGASAATFGHQGFTGTCVWADPESQLIYVFLSNRIFPDDENKRLNTLDTRIKIHQVIYDAMGAGD
ncbi:MAG: serine hydrolase [Chitinophagales bacterium]|nr:serine hydrolase [Chitinophagales bacterium]